MIPWEGDQPPTSTNRNFFGIEPPDHRGLSPDSATADSPSRTNSYGDNAALHTEVTNDPLLRARRDAADTAFVQEKYRENVENRRRILDSFEADALKLAAEPTAARPDRWVDQRSPVLGPVADMANDLAIRVGRDNPTLGGALQVLRLATIGDGSNADLLLAAAPLGFSRLAKLEAKVGGEVAGGRRIGSVEGGAGAGLVDDGMTAAGGPTGASLPLGSKRLQFNQPKNPSYQPVRNESTTIGNTDYSGHALDRMQDRGIMPSVVQNTINTGAATPSRLGTTVYYDAGNNVSVVTNAKGKVVTVKYGK